MVAWVERMEWTTNSKRDYIQGGREVVRVSWTCMHYVVSSPTTPFTSDPYTPTTGAEFGHVDCITTSL